jgi:hypothetical protein
MKLLVPEEGDVQLDKLSLAPSAADAADKSANTSARSGWKATSYHLCIDDHYNVEYEFVFRGTALQWWTMAYDVKGPNKDYRICSTFRR